MTDSPEQMESPGAPSTRTLARGTAWAAIDNWIQQGAQLAAFIVMGKIVGPEVFGIMAMAILYAIFVNAFLVDGFSESIVQRLQVDREHLEAAFWLLAGIGVAASIVSVFAAGLIAAFFSEPALVPIIQWLGISFPLVGTASLFRGKLRRELNFRALAIRSAVVNVGSAALGIWLALSGYGVWSLVAYQLCLRILDFLLLLALCRWLPRPCFSRLHLRDIYSFGANTIAARLVDAVSLQSDRIIIGYFLDATALGLYGLASRIVDTVTYAITGVLNTVALPAFARLQNHNERLAKALTSATELSSLITFPVFAGLAIVAPDVIDALLGEEWQAAAPILQILCFMGYCHPFAIFLMTALRAGGRARLVLRIQTLTTVLRLVLYLVAIRYGAIGVALASVAAAWLVLPLRFYFVERMVGIDLVTLTKGVLPAIGATVIMAACVSAIDTVAGDGIAPGASVVLLTASGVAAYVVALFLVSRSSLKRALRLAGGSAEPLDRSTRAGASGLEADGHSSSRCKR